GRQVVVGVDRVDRGGGRPGRDRRDERPAERRDIDRRGGEVGGDIAVGRGEDPVAVEELGDPVEEFDDGGGGGRPPRRAPRHGRGIAQQELGQGRAVRGI